MSLIQETARLASGMIGRESRLVRLMRPAYESFLDWSSGGRGITWPINRVTYRVDPRHRHRLGQDYDAPVAAFLRERVRPGDTCVDVGANVGVYVLQFAHWSAPGGRVVAFEPNPGARTVLEKHVRYNGLGGRVTVVPAAVSNRAGSATLYAADADGMSRLGEPNRAIAARVREVNVETVTLDEYCEGANLAPDWLFMDIEGFEVAALEGARRLIRSRGREMGIVVEMHPDVWDSAGAGCVELENLLDELKLEAVPLTGQQDALGEHGLVHLKS
ncbi:MAG: FkbM family methyltransferase [Pyrinomonadaceae bacterium]